MDASVELHPETPKKFPWVANPDGIPEIYSNYSHASWSLYEVRVLFGMLKASMGDSTEFVVEERGAVAITWPHLKALSIQIAALLASFESVNGEIKPLRLAPRPEEKNSKIDETQFD